MSFRGQHASFTSVAISVQTMADSRLSRAQAFRKLAKSCLGVPFGELPKDTASRDKFRELAFGVEDSAADEALKAQAAAAFRAYEETWPAEPEGDDEAGEEDEAVGGFRLRGTSFLLTYNWDFFGKDFPDGTAAATSSEELWRLWKQFKAQKKQDAQVKKSTSTLEVSLNSDTPGRVHFHWKVDCEKAFDEPNTDCFAFHGVKPDARRPYAAPGAKAARGANFAEASNRGHFYCWAPKKGTLYTGSNWKPWGNYRVMGKWLDDLWTDGKLEHSTYGSLALSVRVGYAGRKRDLDLVTAAEKEAKVDRQMIRVDAALAKLRAPFLTFAAVEAWQDTFLELRFRWSLLVLVADSASGKSSFAESLFDRPYVLTVEDATHLDLKDFDRDVHDGIVLDNVNSWKQILSWRAVLQARNAKSKGGQSATNVYSYAQYLFGVPVAVTVDLDAPDAELADPTHESRSKWLQKNCVFVRLAAGGVFYDSSKLPQKRVRNRFSLYAETVQRRRSAQAA